MKENKMIKMMLLCVVLHASAWLPAMAQDAVQDALKQAEAAMQMANQATRAANEATAAASAANQAAAQAMYSLRAGDILQVNLAGDILFDFDSSAITTEGARALEQLAGMIRKQGKSTVLVIGHTDNKGTDVYNRKLSQRRAEAVVIWLNQHGGIPLNDLRTEAAGERYPVAPNQHPDGRDNPEGRARNRRVEVQIPLKAGVRLGMGVVQVGGVRLREPEIKDGPGNCVSLCKQTAGRHDMKTIACMEGVLEELGHDMDQGSCGELEDVMLLGVGNAGGKMCKQCVKQAGISDKKCRQVLATCFR